MTDDSLKSILRRLETPPPDAAATERALHRATIALANADQNSAGALIAHKRPGFPRWAVVFGALVVVALLGGLILPRSAREFSPASERAILAQFEQVFPGQIEAVIERDGAVDVELAEKPSAPSDQPLMLTLARGKHAVRVLSYSGRRVCVHLDGRRICFEALLTEDNGVILVGENFVWSHRQSSPLAGYRIKAAALSPAS